jgi:OOP family OmpA-OmpF porin
VDAAPDERGAAVGTDSRVIGETGNGPDADAADELKITVSFQFDTNRAGIKKQYQAGLKRIGDIMKRHRNARAVIEGHTDNVGSMKLNKRLSLRRAMNVKKYLIKTFGISPDRLQAEGHGFSRPISDNDSAEGRAKNRRIEARFSEIEMKPLSR